MLWRVYTTTHKQQMQPEYVLTGCTFIRAHLSNEWQTLFDIFYILSHWLCSTHFWALYTYIINCTLYSNWNPLGIFLFGMQNHPQFKMKPLWPTDHQHSANNTNQLVKEHKAVLHTIVILCGNISKNEKETNWKLSNNN